jgi:PhoPQ-activated pathogenicity-related protein
VFPSDPEKRGRSEDAILAWAWKEFLDDPSLDPKWLPRLPMTKAAFQTMRAAQEFLKDQNIAKIEGWVVAGASKRGWTTWMVGATKCESCAAKILAINPLVPIVPDLVKEIHRQWQAYNGFTFAFSDYTAANLTQHMDDPKFAKALEVIDPINYMERLDKIPKVVVLSSDDEFMMMDWTNIYWN